MNLIPLVRVVLGVVIFSSVTARVQLTVDATGPIREKLRSATTGRAGSIGRKLNMGVDVHVRGTPNGKGEVEIEFVLINSGKTDLTVPTSPNPADLETPDPNATYSIRQLRLFLTSDKKQQSIMPGGAELYGNRTHQGSLVVLAPGESMLVRAMVTLPTTDLPQANEKVFVAHVVLNDQTIRKVNDEDFEDTQEVGSVASPAYTASTLLRSTN